jgi:hypothetical protein
MKIANIHVGTTDQNVSIALQVSYQFAIFMSVCNFHMSLQFSRFDVQFLCGHLQFSYECMQFSYEFATFLSVCNSHVTTPALTYMALHESYVTMILNSLTPHQPQFSVEDKDKIELSKIDYYLLFKSS